MNFWREVEEGSLIPLGFSCLRKYPQAKAINLWLVWLTWGGAHPQLMHCWRFDGFKICKARFTWKPEFIHFPNWGLDPLPHGTVHAMKWLGIGISIRSHA